MRTLYWYLHLVFTLIMTYPNLLKAKKQKEIMPEKEFFKMTEEFTRKWALKQVKASGARFHVSGFNNIPKSPVLFVSNHQSNFDIAAFISYIEIPKGFVAKAELLKIPILRTWMKYLNCVFLDRTDIKQSAKIILDGINILKSGHSMVVFPEGTRSKSDIVGEFKSGSFKLATKSKVPIVPVTINGSYKIMEANKSKIKPADVYITIHPPVYTNSLTKEELNEIPSKIENIIKSALDATIKKEFL